MVRTEVEQALGRTKPSVPDHTVLSLWRRAQQRLYVAATDLYDRRVVDAVGVRALQGGLDQQRSVFLTYSPRITARETTPEGEILTVTAGTRYADDDSVEEITGTYLLRRSEGRWVIFYDTLTEDGLYIYAQLNSPAQGSDEKSKKQAAADGRKLAERFRLVSQGAAADRD